MHRRSLSPLLAVLLALLAAPCGAHAGASLKYTDKTMGFGLTVPAGWHVTKTRPVVAEIHVLFYSQGKHIYAFDVGELTGIKGGASIQAALATFTAYEKRLKNTPYEKAKWTAAGLGGRPARFTVISAVTEGGVVESQGTVLANSRGHVFLVTFTSNGKHFLKTVAQFPTPYQQMLRSWRWTK
jgi:hypothetical protein